MNYEIVELPRHLDRRGNLSVVENDINIPFKIQRVYYLYDVPGGESRGGHAHRNTYEMIIAVGGSFTVNLEFDGKEESVLLNKPYIGLLIYPGVWRTLVDFSSGAVALVLASELFCEQDYIRDYNEFKLIQSKAKINN